MELLEAMRRSASAEMSPFQAQLLKEDIARLDRVQQLAEQEVDLAAFSKKALVLGWTQGDLRTFELQPELGAFLEIVFAAKESGDQAGVADAWKHLHKRRMDLLVGCLSRPRLD